MSGYLRAGKMGGGEAGTNYRGPAVKKGAGRLTILRMFLSLSVVSSFVDCTN
jgi:hypothetical protein